MNKFPWVPVFFKGIALFLKHAQNRPEVKRYAKAQE